MSRLLTYPAVIVALTFGTCAHAQEDGGEKEQFNEKFQVTFVLSPSWESFGPRDKAEKQVAKFGSKLSYNFGIEYKHFASPDFSTSIALMYQNKGFRNEVEVVTTDSTSNAFEGQFGIIIGSAEYIAAPVDFNFHWDIKKKTRFIFSLGLTPGYLINESIKGKRFPEDLANTGSGSVINIENGKSDPDMFRPYFLGFNVGMALTQYIKSKFVVVVQPKYTRGLTKAIKETAPVVGGQSAKLDSYAIDFRVGYYFNRQIKNQNKDF